MALSGMGMIEARAHHDGEAARYLEDAHHLNPANLSTASALAAVYVDQSQFFEAEPLIDEIRQAGAATEDTRLSLAALALKNGNPGLGAKAVAGESAAEHSYYEMCYTKAVELVGESHYPEALRVLTAAEFDAPLSAEYHDLLGTVYYHLDEPAKSVNELQEAIRLAPSDPDHYFKLGMMFLKHRTGDGAVLVFEAALKARPDVPKLWMGLGLSYYIQNQMGQAKENLQHALSLDPKYGPAYLVLCDMFLQNGADEELKGILGKAMEAEPDDYLLSYYYGRILAKTENANAVTQFEKSIHLNPRFSGSYLELGKYYFYSNNTPKSIEAFTQCLSVDPDAADAHFFLSRIYYRLGQKKLAASQLAAFNQGRKGSGEDEHIQQLIFQVEK